ncbi:hypothetical protein MGM1_1260 [Candidatus Malacoplasma girerdii]|uniref:Uncharacterized protein n=1 Tax=Candidatus Malacoplasma girerdii TaxID=1318617 RepID=A0A097SSE2_9BACT|nr:hypothetical protein MGM1_1260 [Candidatus Malacoplasma girerdii]ASJ89123.1 MAG: hypothetical protein B1217_0229 [Candidatus Malacoplasma girerdii]
MKKQQSQWENIVNDMKQKTSTHTDVNKYVKDLQSKGVNVDEILEQFIKMADANPHDIRSRNCDSGKCNAIDIDKEGN